MAITNSLKNLMLEGAFGDANTIQVSLHTANPGTTGLYELTGGSYARQDVDYSAASLGSKANSNVVTFTDLPTATVTYAGFWYNSTFLQGALLTTPRSILSGDGLYFSVANIVHMVS